MRLPALVEPGPPLPAAEAERTARHLRLPELGELGQRRLHAARVLVLGAGGLGAPSLLYLAAAGVGTIGIVDDDDVDASNLQRQVIHGVGDVGTPKTASAARRMREVAPDVDVVEIRERLEPDNAAAVIGGWDVVLDGTDNFATRYLVSDTCAELRVPLVWASVLRFDAQVSVFWTPPTGEGVTLRDLFPQPPAPGSVPSCADAGVIGALCGIVGSMMALEAVKLIAGFGDVLLGRVAVVDALTLRVHDLPLHPSRGSSQASRGSSQVSRGSSQVSRGSSPVASAGPLVDVREPGEAAEAGDVLPGAVVVPLGLIEQADRTPDPLAALITAGLPIPNGAGPAENHLGELENHLGKLGNYPGKLENYLADGGGEVLRLYCRSGARAQRAARTLRALGIPALALMPDDVDRLRADLSSSTSSSAPISDPPTRSAS